jgi:N utilization substance protein B
MAVAQQKFREIVFQLLYSQDQGASCDVEMIPFLMKELSVTKKTVKEALEKAKRIQAKQSDVDVLISQASLSYNFERIQTVEKNLLRLGAYELLFDNEIPPKVAISEALRLARKFGTPESANFVNAILDAIYKAHLGENVDSEKVVRSFEKLIESEETAKKASETHEDDREET